ncbi:hypothetical protein PB01_11715 [Psychrobacillus glaciei]|uniref:Resolvase HTH domain-containing protein n=1 Tax=Psychrobacillus glaciei TaxID=2283160 RepID=A0A5J6SNY2_9BACI|nr:hypothetical protein [Psychrobacillus glaciei]QFF99439.1 hypothetical protein PB01_11715 [Psychrobacillus glaciei]
MDYSIIIMVIGIILIIVSFFVKDSVKKMETEMEDLSFTLYQETSALKRRLKMVEEELLMEPTKIALPAKQKTKSVIHDIIKSQVLELHKQGYSLPEISKRSSLTVEEVKSVIGGGK